MVRLDRDGKNPRIISPWMENDTPSTKLWGVKVECTNSSMSDRAVGRMRCSMCWTVWQREKWGNWCTVAISGLSLVKAMAGQCLRDWCQSADQRDVFSWWANLIWRMSSISFNTKERQKVLLITFYFLVPLITVSTFALGNLHSTWHSKADVCNRAVSECANTDKDTVAATV